MRLALKNLSHKLLIIIAGDLAGMQVLAVINFPPRQIADYMYEVPVLGTYSEDGVVLIRPNQIVKNGDRLG